MSHNIIVTPCVGVWIEIRETFKIAPFPGVTPCVGVWIEIIRLKLRWFLSGSLPAWECGLKSTFYELFQRRHLSLPAWECGLKYRFVLKLFVKNLVTPCVGVWIEIVNYNPELEELYVTPCVGVWIEIVDPRDHRKRSGVTPCVGVWIEIPYKKIKKLVPNGHSLRGSVDWNVFRRIQLCCISCHSLRGSVDWNLLSKLLNLNWPWSLPAWECGLKSVDTCYYRKGAGVTPCVGVWIEIVYSISDVKCIAVTPCVGVWIEISKPFLNPAHGFCHSLRGSVDWNIENGVIIKSQIGHSLRGSVDWNYGRWHFYEVCGGHSLRGSVDWNQIYTKLR